MKTNLKLTCSFLLFLVFLNLKCFSQPSQKEKYTRILLIFDASGSMWGEWNGTPKITSAKNTLIKLVDSLRTVKNLEIALRVYGHNSPPAARNCKDTKLEVPFYVDNHDEIIRKIKSIRPKGTTPIAYSLERAANDFPDTRAKNVIILITDGIEECNGDPCAISKALQKKGVIVKPFVIGLGIDLSYINKLNCIGKLLNAKTADDFGSLLSKAINQSSNKTTVQFNLFDLNKKPTQTNVNIILYDSKSGQMRYTFFHTLNHLGNPDTLIIDPNTTYNMQVSTLPKIDKKNIKLKNGVHNTVSVDAPQGNFVFNTGGVGNKDLLAVIRQNGKIVNVQNVNIERKYLVGTYDLDILTLPRINKKLKITEGKTKQIKVEQPGRLTVETSDFTLVSIFVQRGKNWEWVYNTDINKRRELIYLQPGVYMISWRKRRNTKTELKKYKIMKIVSNASKEIKLK